MANSAKQREQDSLVSKSASARNVAREKKRAARLKRLKDEEQSEFFLVCKHCKYQLEDFNF